MRLRRYWDALQKIFGLRNRYKLLLFIGLTIFTFDIDKIGLLTRAFFKKRTL